MPSNPEHKNEEKPNLESPAKRDFLTLGAACIGCVGAAVVAVPFIDSLSPDQGTLAAGSVEVDISNIKEGETHIVAWRGKPIFIKHRTKAEIEEAINTKEAELRDPEPDSARVKKGKEAWLVTIGICTHLGCVPISGKGDFGGWFCPCHGSHYDTSGRVRKGPAPLNLAVPEYTFLTDTLIKIG